MRLVIAVMLLASVPTLRAAQSSTLRIRNKEQVVALLPSSAAPARAVIFLPGDGGWRGLAITIGETVSSWGYDVYGFDTKRYLESFSEERPALTTDQMQRDLRQLVDWVRSRGAPSVTLLGWSQGAAMAVLAGANSDTRLAGVLTIGLPESAVLGWNWRDTLAVLSRREPAEPHFTIEPFIASLATPLWMVHGGGDEFTSPAAARRLYDRASAPKHLVEIEGANHRADGKRAELFQALRDGLEWVRRAQP